MLDWLRANFDNGEPPGWDVILVRLLAAMLCGLASAGIYAWTHRRDQSFTLNFLATLVLLAILIATITQVIGGNVARAFGLVGALAIVRFRTVVEDARDTAFVMLSVILGMAVGAGHFKLALATIGFAGVTAVAFQARRQGEPEASATGAWTLFVRTGLGHDPGALVQEVLAKHLESFRLIAAATARQGAALESTWAATLRAGASPAELVAELNRIEGVQSVEIRRSTPRET